MPDGRVDLGYISSSQVFTPAQSGFSVDGGVVRDAEVFEVRRGTTSVFFEFVNTSVADGRRNDTVPIFFNQESRLSEIVASTRIALINAGLGLAPTDITTQRTTVNGDTLKISDTPQFRYGLSAAPLNITRSGIPGGAVPVRFIRSGTFTTPDLNQAIIQAIRGLGDNTFLIGNSAKRFVDVY